MINCFSLKFLCQQGMFTFTKMIGLTECSYRSVLPLKVYENIERKDKQIKMLSFQDREAWWATVLEVAELDKNVESSVCCVSMPEN